MIGATLFSGIGAPEVAMPEWLWPWHAEIEKFPSAVMKLRHPQSVNLGDVSAHDFAERALASGRPDVVVFGSPCQSFSIAGGRLGLDDPRGNLALAGLAVIERVRPRWFVFENVPDLVSSYSGGAEAERRVRENGGTASADEDSDFAAFLSAAHDVGYSLAWTVLDAQYFKLAQRRERLFVVGYLGDGFGPAAVLFEPESLCGDHPPRRQAGQSITHDVAGCLTGRRADHTGESRGQDAVIATGPLTTGLSKQRIDDPMVVAGAVSSKWAKGTGGPAGDECYNLVSAPIAFDTTQISSAANRSNPQPGDPCHTLAAGAHAPAIAFNITPSNSNKDYNARQSERAQALQAGNRGPSARGGDVIVQPVAETLTAHSHKGNGAKAGNRVGMVNPIITPHAVRRLTPRECERLQGFPDDYTLIKYRGAPATDSPRYKALGNSMPVPVLRYILSRIEAVDLVLRAP